MDLRIEHLRKALIKKIEASMNEEKLSRMLTEFDREDHGDQLMPLSPSKEEYVARTNKALRTVREGRVYTLEEARKQFGIRGN